MSEQEHPEPDRGECQSGNVQEWAGANVRAEHPEPGRGGCQSLGMTNRGVAESESLCGTARESGE
ncbi:MAG: hypothetical protein Q4C60_10325 [Eubacteriales bacterium]|nr:hypothetical protein [Eubacteriales bacterium]